MTAGKRQKQPRVAVLVDTSTSWGRGIIHGIHDYALRRGWQLFLEPLGIEQHVNLSGKWTGDGVIARVGYPDMAVDLKKLRVPIVNVSGIILPRVTFPRVTVDVSASATLAAEYYLAKGFRNFAYFGIRGLAYVGRHQKAFIRVLKQQGCRCSVFDVAAHHGAEPDWQQDIATIGKWISRLPRPVAVLTWNAGGAREVLYACHAAGVHVPEEVSILAGSDDDLFCELSPVPLSGIQPPASQLGATAAGVLDLMMRGKPAPAALIQLPPERIISRRSTDSFAVNDPALVKALQFIRDNTSRPIQVQDVARASAVSRRILERRFNQVLHRSPADEIRRVHLEHAVRLLCESALTIPEVAEAAGFSSPEYFAFVFKRAMGKPPLEFRKDAGMKGQSD